MARAALFHRENPHQDEARVGDRGVGQHALDVILHEASKGTDEDRQDRHGREDVQEVPLQVGGGDRVEADHRSEGRDLHGGSHEARHRGRGARVDIGGPCVEGGCAHLEQQADHHAEDAHEDHPLHVRMGGDGLGQRGDAQRVGEAEEEGGAHEQEARGEGAEHEVLEGRLVGQLATTAGRGSHDVQGQRHDLEGHEQGHEVVRRGEDHHAAQGEQGQREDLGTLVALALRQLLGGRVRTIRGLAGKRAVTDGGTVGHHEDGEEADDDEGRLSADRQRILHVLPQRHRSLQDGDPAQGEHDTRTCGRQDRQTDHEGTACLGGGKGLDEDAEDRAAQHDEDRREAHPVNLGGLEVIHG